MAVPADLAALARRLGIATDYTDALGRHRDVAAESMRAIVTAFGLPSDAAAATRALDERERAAPLGLSPVQVVAAEDPRPQVPLRLAGGAEAAEWTCRLEGGVERCGRAALEGTALPLPTGLPLGYHRLEIGVGGVRAETGLVVAPTACHLPAALAPGRRVWGLTCQLYGLVSAGNGGIGDFTDLAALAEGAGGRGAATLGVNPLHALFAAEPLHVSPYSPSSRRFLDHRYIDLAALPGFAEDEAVRGLAAEPWYGPTHWAARSGELIDYGAVAACRRPVLEALYRRFRARELDGGASGTLGGAFRTFQRDGGAGLADFAVFEALHEHFRGDRQGFSWHAWPEPMRDPRSAAVAEFAAARRDRVEFFQWLQFWADRQLAVAAAAGRAGGLDIGLYRDLAVGANPHGADAWADQELLAPGIAIGAPPDALGPDGQDWGLAPVNPLALRQQGYAPFVAILRANMRHAGLLRIDHAMSLDRLYWIPAGMPASAGTYVDYPFADLLRLLALESRRQSCAVIGEDLGTVPAGFRERMQAAAVLSYRVLRFERRGDGGYVPPAEYPPLAAAVAATHDIATVKGFWLGCDLAWRRRLGQYADGGAAAAAERARDRRLLLEALVRERLLPPERLGEFLPAEGEPRWTPELRELIFAYLARSQARLMLVQLEDITGEAEEANLPGTNDEHPNWRRRLSRSLEDLLAGEDFRHIATLLAAERARGP